MGSVNVNCNVSDDFYRYKMPRLIAKVEGKGNGIKTVIANMTDVAKAISRPATYPIKYFGCELGAQTQLDFKNDRFIVNGSHDAEKLQGLLHEFIQKFVLCPSCENPETVLSVNKKKQAIIQACQACGYNSPLKFNHKLNPFIIKNPPKITTSIQGGGKSDKRGTGRKRSKQENNTKPETSGETRNFRKINKQVKECADINKERRGGSANYRLSETDDDDEVWSVDVSEAAVRARLQDLSESAKGLVITDHLKKLEKENLDVIYEMVKHKRDAGVIDSADKEILAEAKRLAVKSKVPLILAELLLDHNMHQQVKKHRILFLRFTHEDQKAQKFLLGGIEQVIALHKDALLPKVSGILKLFYDADILEEKVLLDWAAKVTHKNVPKELAQDIHARAKTFITWLREAEEESEGSEEEDCNRGSENVDRANEKPLNELKNQPTMKPIEDLDIDAI
ncbi:hypothetical protein R5R35_008722 [Gryllus longicercus]|uniref:Eukaryotic translation initiation factor 5 n=1 Tax=Gryllus longicercus TaxID=2509291 RepID=A0AAN9VHA5_9ORTH